MTQKTKVVVLFKDNFLADLHDGLDQLHTAASEGRLHAFTSLGEQAVLDWLQDLRFTLDETMREVMSKEGSPCNVIRLLDRPEFKNRLSS